MAREKNREKKIKNGRNQGFISLALALALACLLILD
jgi:hypothetical protein